MPIYSPVFHWLIALAAMLWGGDLLLRPLALSSGWSPAGVVFGEHLLLTAVFGGILIQGWRTLCSLTRNQWAALLFVSWGGSALATWLYTEAFTLGSPLTAILLQKTQPIFALIGAWVWLGERRQTGFWVWCVLALVGTLLLIGMTRIPSLTDIHTKQALCALGAAALWGGATVAGRVLTPVLSPSLLAGARFAAAVPLLALMTRLPSAHAMTATHRSSYAFFFLLLIVLLPDLLGMRLYYAGLCRTPASVATLAELCYPVTALLIGLFVQQAILTWGQWVGFGLLLLAVLGLGLVPSVSVRIQTRLGRVS